MPVFVPWVNILNDSVEVSIELVLCFSCEGQSWCIDTDNADKSCSSRKLH